MDFDSGSLPDTGGNAALVQQVVEKTVFVKIATERTDIDVIQVFIESNSDLRVPVGLEVNAKTQVDQKI
ncbi:hypothetical protein ACH50O_01115 [Methylomonas sp. 2BW1-5-20]|uniref:hypothetical protein n=1 Tax=Methylomonas sp. 2BW1-5-20 TaxID=3376686 RepID=UPI004050EE8F